MKNSITSFIKEFSNRKGFRVLFSGLLIKFIGLILSILIVRILPEEEYGYIAFAISITGILTAFSGMGFNWSLLRYGAQSISQTDKLNLYTHSISKGTLYTIPLVLFVFVISFFLPEEMKSAQWYLVILSIGMITNYLLNVIKSFFRILNLNNVFSTINIYSSILLFTLAISLSYLFEAWGYITALVVGPLIVFCYFHLNKVPFVKKKNEFQLPSKYTSYGIYTGLGMIANQAVITLGPVIAGYLNVEAVDIAIFKVSTIIPLNLLFIPAMILTTDFVHLSKSYNDSSILIKYYRRYLITIGGLMLLPFCFSIYFSEEIMKLFFGPKYVDAAPLFSALMIGIFFSFLFRVPLGNMLAAIGKANWNVVHSIIWLVLFIPLSYFLYNHYGLIGFTYSMSFVFIFSGLVSLCLMAYYYKMIKVN